MDTRLFVEFLIKNTTSNRLPTLSQANVSGNMLHYYYPTQIGLNPEIYRFFKKLIDDQVTVHEIDNFVTSFLSHISDPFLKRLFFRKETSLFDVSDVSERQTIQHMLASHAADFYMKRSYFAPLHAFIGENWSGANFSILDLTSQDSPLHSRSMITRGDLENVKRWLRLSARNKDFAREKEEVFLGAVCLAMYPATRYQFVMFRPPRGWIDEDGSRSIAVVDEHLPPIGNFEVSAADFNWFKVVDQLLSDDGNPKHSNSLRSLYRTWFVQGTQRFEMFTVAIDALMPSSCNGYRKKCEWISKNCGEEVDMFGLEILFRQLRSDVAHGDAASIQQSKHYGRFLELYAKDPLEAVEHIACRVLQRNIFGDKLRVQDHPISLMEKSDQIRDIYLRETGATDLPDGCISLDFLNRGHVNG